MGNKFEAYRELEEADRNPPWRFYTIRLVTMRKHRIIKVLWPLLASRPSELDLEDMAVNIEKAIACSKPSGSPAHLRKKHHPKAKSNFIDFIPFRETPEETDPRGKELAGPILESLGQLPDEDLDLDELEEVSWRFAGNIHKLACGQPVPPWEPDWQGEEWCMVRVAEVVEAETFEGEAGFKMTYFFYTGTPAGREFSRTFKSGYEAKFANEFGIQWKYAKMVYPQDLTNMTGYVFLQPGVGKGRIPIFRQTMATDAHKRHNRQLHRDRLDYTKCPYRLKPDCILNCVDCEMVYENSKKSSGCVCQLAVKRGKDGDASDSSVRGDQVVRTGT